MKKRDVVIAVMLGLTLWLISFPYRLDYLGWIDSTVAWLASAVLGLVAVIVTLAFFFRSQRAVTSPGQRTKPHEGDEPR